jgi:hypothetical protein
VDNKQAAPFSLIFWISPVSPWPETHNFAKFKCSTSEHCDMKGKIKSHTGHKNITDFRAECC